MPKKTPAPVAAAAAPLPLTYTTPDGRTYPVTGLKAPKGYSYSQLKAYEDCGALHDLVRNQRLIKGFEGSVYTAIGNACHDPLETWLNQYLSEDAPAYETPYDYMVAADGYWDTKLKAMGLLDLKPRLQTYAFHTTNLYYRSSASFKGPDAIRKADGTVPKAPQMTTPWKDYARKHGLAQMESEINTLAARVDAFYKAVPFAQVYAESLGIMYPYKHPEAIASVVAVELPVSEVMFQAQQPVMVQVAVGLDELGNEEYDSIQAVDKDGNLMWEPMVDAEGQPVPSSVRRGPHPVWMDEAGRPVNFLFVENPFWLPQLDSQGHLIPDPDKPGDYLRRTDAVFTAFIDLLARDADGCLGVVDHKTNGGDAPKPAYVGLVEQFNLYAKIVHLQYDEQADWLAMNHLRSNTLVRSPYVSANGTAALERLLSLIRSIEMGVFTKADPLAYSNPCVKKPARDNEPLQICEGLKFCHPNVHAMYKQMGLAA